MKLRLGDHTLIFLYCALIFHLSHHPVLSVPQLFPHQDKMHHLLAYAVMASLAAGIWHAGQRRMPVEPRQQL